MWRKALIGIPRLKREDWDKLDIFSRYLIATRAAVLIITLISSCIAGILAYKRGLFDFKIWMLVTLGLMFAHATNNLLNDLVDWKKGVDKDNYFRNKYGTHPLSVMSEKEFLRYVLFTGCIALSIGLYLCYLKGLIVIYLTLCGSFFLLFYTYPLKYIALGEVSVFVVWGLLMIGGGYYTITNEWNWNVVIASFPYSLGVTTIIFGKHIDKLNEDKNKGIHTLPVVLGEKLSRMLVLGMILLQYVLVLYMVYSGAFGMGLLICLLAIFDNLRTKLFTVFTQPKPGKPPAAFPQSVWPLWYVAFAFAHNRAFGSLFLLGLMLSSTSAL